MEKVNIRGLSTDKNGVARGGGCAAIAMGEDDPPPPWPIPSQLSPLPPCCWVDGPISKRKTTALSERISRDFFRQIQFNLSPPNLIMFDGKDKEKFYLLRGEFFNIATL